MAQPAEGRRAGLSIREWVGCGGQDLVELWRAAVQVQVLDDEHEPELACKHRPEGRRGGAGGSGVSQAGGAARSRLRPSRCGSGGDAGRGPGRGRRARGPATTTRVKSWSFMIARSKIRTHIIENPWITLK